MLDICMHNIYVYAGWFDRAAAGREGEIRAGELVRNLTDLFDKLESLPKEARNVILCLY